jgi:hypothetical protein
MISFGVEKGTGYIKPSIPVGSPTLIFIINLLGTLSWRDLHVSIYETMIETSQSSAAFFVKKKSNVFLRSSQYADFIDAIWIDVTKYSWHQLLN